MIDIKSTNKKEVVQLITPFLTPLLIALIGIMVSHWEGKKQQQENQKEFMQNFSEQLYSRHAIGGLMLSTIEKYNDASSEESQASLKDELIKRKQKYDDTYLTWNQEHQANLFLLRKILSETVSQSLLAEGRNELSIAIFTDDACITRLYDNKIHGIPLGDVTLRGCKAKYTEVKTCIAAYTNNLYELIESKNKASELIEKIESSCEKTT